MAQDKHEEGVLARAHCRDGTISTGTVDTLGDGGSEGSSVGSKLIFKKLKLSSSSRWQSSRRW